MYEISVLEEKYFKVFQGIYNDFRLKAGVDYRFELEPLTYDDFISSFQKELINCILLLEDSIPTGFLVYTMAQNNAIEIFMMHFLGNENLDEKRTLLLEKFMELTKSKRKHMIVSYPMLGVQEGGKKVAAGFGFNFVDTGVVCFDIKNKQKIKELSSVQTMELPIGYKLTPYRDIYFDELSEAVLNSFRKSSDLKFDTRFATIEGCQDITNKITTSIYGRFLPQASKILLYENKLVGFCLVNVIGNGIANLTLIGILEEHRGLRLSKPLVKSSVFDIVELYQAGITELNEINATLDFNMPSAVKMYESIGFVQSYKYPQAYLPRG